MSPPDLWSGEWLALLFLVFVAAGAMKGIVGFGLPMVVVALLAAILGVPTAIALMVVPAIITNIWQAARGNAFRELIARLWPFLATACVFIWLASGLLARADASVLTGGLGALLCAYALISLATPQVPPPGRHERWLSPAIGAVNGTVTGLTGTYVMPSGIYLQAMGLRRDTLVQAMGIVFTASSVMLAVALTGRSILSGDLAGLSALAVAPSFIGVWVGQKLRRRLPEAQFRKAFFVGLAVLGVYFLWRATIG